MNGHGTPSKSGLAKRWPATRAKGMAHFVLVRGMLLWGGLMFALSIVMTLVRFGPQHPRVGLLLGVAAGLSAIGGLSWGLLTWIINERIFRDLNPPPNSDQTSE
ncbi:MAG: hypothetical protein M3Q51_04190 [Pseudomonadota bacterium]|nr:hypothetical protein [Pseudomonadota bacterium]MDQ3160208.1 hypothetical protein [Pseudomonadota bacterium]